MTAKTTTHKHPKFPFIEVHLTTYYDLDPDIDLRDAEGLPSEIRIGSTVGGDVLQHDYFDPFATPADECLARALQTAEQAFFYERGPFYHLRGKMAEAATRGDLDTLCALAEGRGYWQGVRAAAEEVMYAAQDIEDRVPIFEGGPVPSALFADIKKAGAEVRADAPDDDIPF
jgi:hypothetical protein